MLLYDRICKDIFYGRAKRRNAMKAHRDPTPHIFFAIDVIPGSLSIPHSIIRYPTTSTIPMGHASRFDSMTVEVFPPFS